MGIFTTALFFTCFMFTYKYFRDNKIKIIQQKIRDLRDADSHVCREQITADTRDCSCVLYDEIIDDLDEI